MKDRESCKAELREACLKQLANRRKAIDERLLQLSKSLEEETKSSAGDKHETGRAMLQLEREKAGHQLAEIEKLENISNRLSSALAKGPAHLGCVIETTEAHYYLAIPAGEIKIDNQIYYAIAVASPIGQLLLGKSEGASIVFRESTFTIEAIY
ncbi:MAG: 3-oxoacyl-ACP synthase [Cytophagaceae bacterium]|nr:3-oxoacyl-ACP synthase [Cytophagaceae bacterium]